MSKSSKFVLQIILLCLCVSLFSQYLEIYETNSAGLKNITPSIIIDEDIVSSDYKVYSINQFGLKNISPDEIIENDEFTGRWSIYRVNNLGLKEIVPEKIAEEDKFRETINIYNVSDLGLKDISPSTIIERDDLSGNIKLYNVNKSGLKSISPFEVIKKVGDQYHVHAVNNLGLTEITPKRIIEVKENPNVFGILLLPSIKQITFNPSHSRIEYIQRIKQMIKENREKEGWITSEPRKQEKTNFLEN